MLHVGTILVIEMLHISCNDHPMRSEDTALIIEMLLISCISIRDEETHLEDGKNFL